MSETPTPPPEPAPERSRALRITIRVGETVAVLGLLFGVATFLVQRQDRAREETAAKAEKAKVERRQQRAAALILKGEAADDGSRIGLSPADAEQLIQEQTYVFPRSVRESARRIAAGEPQIDRAWIEDGLKRAAREAAPRGDATVPVAIETTFIQDGETRTDRTLYRVGYRIEDALVGRSSVRLLGLSRVRPAAAGPLQPQVDALWPPTSAN